MDQLYNTAQNATATFNSLPIDTLILLCVFGALYVFALWRGKAKMIALILASYPAYLFAQITAPLVLSLSTHPALSVGVFVLAWLFVYFSIRGYMEGMWWPQKTIPRYGSAGVLAFSLTGLLLAFSTLGIDVSSWYTLSSPLSSAFGTPITTALWLVLPFIAIRFA